MNIIDFLNFQPFGDHGVMSLCSIRIAHIIMITAVTYLAKDIIKDLLNMLKILKLMGVLVYINIKMLF